MFLKLGRRVEEMILSINLFKHPKKQFFLPCPNSHPLCFFPLSLSRPQQLGMAILMYSRNGCAKLFLTLSLPSCITEIHRRLFFVCLFVFCLFAFFRAAAAAYGDSQARGLIGAVATGLHHSSQQRQILNPLSKARDRTCNLMVPSQIR